MASNTSTAPQVPSSEQIYSSINGEIVDAQALLTSLNQQLSIYQEQVSMYQSQLTFTQADSTYVTGLEGQINTLNAALANYLAFLSTRVPPLSYAQTQLDTAQNVLPLVYTQIEAVSVIVYQAITNVNTVNNAVALTYTQLMAYNQGTNPLSNNQQSGVLPPSANLAPTLDACMKSGLTTLETLANLFLQLIDFMMQIQALIGLTTYLADGFTDQAQALQAIQAHLDYRYDNDTLNVSTITTLLATSKANVASTQANIAAVNLDLGLLNVESAAAVNSTQSTGNLLPGS